MPNDFNAPAGAVQSFIPIEADDILQELASTEDTWATGASLYGPGGLFDATRKAKLSVIGLQIRDYRADKGEKTTEAMIEQLAHADDTYTTFLDEHVRDRANWLALDAVRDRLKLRLKLLSYMANPR